MPYPLDPTASVELLPPRYEAGPLSGWLRDALTETKLPPGVADKIHLRCEVLYARRAATLKAMGIKPDLAAETVRLLEAIEADPGFKLRNQLWSQITSKVRKSLRLWQGEEG